MKNLVDKILLLHKNKKIKNTVRKRIKEFEQIGRSSKEKIFSELSFCILTANFDAKKCVEIQEKVGDGFLTLSKKSLAKKLKDLGYRFPNKRAEYIVEAREKIKSLTKILKSNLSEYEKREWIVKNIKGIGYKEASHFLRNIGYKDVAIIDFHILNLLRRHKLISKKPEHLTRKRYLEIERTLRKIAEKLNISLAELDLYLWYIETGKILK